MTDPKQSANDWNLQNLPVLTEVVDDEDVGALDVPAFDFSAELDELARSLPAEDIPELELPPELSLDDVLGEVADSQADQPPALDASKLIESLPSLDLEVDQPGELTLDDVLPGMNIMADSEGAAAENADFAFLLDAAGAAAPAASAEAGLDALFARARFEPLLPAADAAAMPVAEPCSVDSDESTVAALAAQLDQFAAPAEMPDLPADAFLADAAANVATDSTLIPAAEPDPVWADNWQPPALPEPADEALPPVVSDVLAAEPPLLAEEADMPAPELDGSYHVSMDDFLAALQPAVTAGEAPQVAPPAVAGLAVDAANLDAASSISAAPWDDAVVAAEALPVDAAFAVEAAMPGEFEAGEPSEAISGAELPESAALSATAEDAVLAADADWSLGEPVVPDWLAEPLAQPEVTAAAAMPPEDAAVPGREAAVDTVAATAAATLPPETAAAVVPVLTDVADSLADDDGWPQETVPAELEELVARPAMPASPAAAPLDSADWQPEAEAALDDEAGWPQQAEAELAPVLADSLAGAESVLPAADGPPLVAAAAVTAEVAADWSMLDAPPDAPRAPAEPPLQTISLDSLPTGVLGGGLGLASAAAAATAAAQLGASAEQLPGGDGWPLRDQLRSSADERDVELDWARDLHAEAPQAPMALEPEAMVMRSRRQPAAEDGEPALTVAPPFTMAPTPLPLEGSDIRVESVTPPLAATAPLGNVDEDALIEALYARVLPRMKVELTLWMQDALEQQAKSLISGVMQQMKEDFDMMLAQSLKESLREALDEVAPRHGKDN
ncbi:hypothetical protein ACFOLG_03200 [Vogesella facilis]|uniref:Uncharacterized protein n=1 Tax=Vogesella facilis TaxID=1655232 RepID=A0ABV7RCL5_9NEIS